MMNKNDEEVRERKIKAVFRNSFSSERKFSQFSLFACTWYRHYNVYWKGSQRAFHINLSYDDWNGM